MQVTGIQPISLNGKTGGLTHNQARLCRSLTIEGVMTANIIYAGVQMLSDMVSFAAVSTV
jgi:hypothetical protein